MNLRVVLADAFGPHEISRRPLFIALAVGLLCVTPRACLFAKDIATRKAR